MTARHRWGVLAALAAAAALEVYAVLTLAGVTA